MRKALLLIAPLALIEQVGAHCPLCTAGAGAAAAGAVWLGVSKSVIGVFIGAFAVSMGWWVSKSIKKQYVKFQMPLIIALSFLTTVLPLLKLLHEYYPVYISLFGDYGSLFNRTYLIDLFLVGSILGAIMVSTSPWMSKKITELRNGETIPFQGIALTFISLIIISTIMQIIT